MRVFAGVMVFFAVLAVLVAVLPRLASTTCTVGRVGTAMTETLSGPRNVVTCDAWVRGNPKLLFLTDQPDDAEHHVLCEFHFGDVTRTVRDTGAGMWGAQRCQQLANGQLTLS